MTVKWYAIHLPVEVVNDITKQPVSICSSVSQDFNLKKLQEKFGVNNVVELSRKPQIDDRYNKSTKKIEKITS